MIGVFVIVILEVLFLRAFVRLSNFSKSDDAGLSPLTISQVPCFARVSTGLSWERFHGQIRRRANLSRIKPVSCRSREMQAAACRRRNPASTFRR